MYYNVIVEKESERRKRGLQGEGCSKGWQREEQIAESEGRESGKRNRLWRKRERRKRVNREPTEKQSRGSVSVQREEERKEKEGLKETWGGEREKCRQSAERQRVAKRNTKRGWKERDYGERAQKEGRENQKATIKKIDRDQVRVNGDQVRVERMGDPGRRMKERDKLSLDFN